MPQAATKPVSAHCITDFAGDHEAHAGRLPLRNRPIGREMVHRSNEVEDEGAAGHAPTATHRVGELVAVPQPRGSGKHETN